MVSLRHPVQDLDYQQHMRIIATVTICSLVKEVDLV